MFTGSSVYDRRPDTEQCAFAVAWKGASWADPDSVPLMVMQTMLGEWRVCKGIYHGLGVVVGGCVRVMSVQCLLFGIKVGREVLAMG